jgi:ankyrin repeat protein
MASWKGHAEVVRLLLENKADITVVDNIGSTPVYMASLKGHVEVVKLLLENKADITVASNNG